MPVSMCSAAPPRLALSNDADFDRVSKDLDAELDAVEQAVP